MNCSGVCVVSVDVKHHNNELMSCGAAQYLYKGFVVDVSVFLFSVLNRNLNSKKIVAVPNVLLFRNKS